PAGRMTDLAGLRRGHIAIPAAAGCGLYQAQLADIPGDRGLGYIKSLIPQIGEKFLLPVNGMLFNQVQYGLVPCASHGSYHLRIFFFCMAQNCSDRSNAANCSGVSATNRSTLSPGSSSQDTRLSAEASTLSRLDASVTTVKRRE